MNPRVRVAAFFVLCGFAMNWTALLANGGHMPVAGTVIGHGVHVMADESTRLWYLCDVLWGGSSPGDIVLGVSMLARIVLLILIKKATP